MPTRDVWEVGTGYTGRGTIVGCHGAPAVRDHLAANGGSLCEPRRLGGPGVARVVLRELRALFAHAVETGSLEMTPAGVLRGRVRPPVDVAQSRARRRGA